MTYIFADCTLDTRLYTLRRAGRSLRLPPKVFQVLLYLLEHRDHVVSKQELCEQVWPQQFISNAALESCIRLVRLSVGDNGHVQEVIQTHRGHGYRFVATVDVRPVIHMGRTPQTASAALVPPAVPTREPRLPALAPTPALHQPGVPADFLGPRRTPQCPACQHTNREDAAFCAACGTRLRRPCASCGRDVPLPAAFCIACGKPLPVLAPLPAVFPAVGMLGPSGAVSMPPVRAAIGEERKPVTVLCCSVAHAATDRAHLDLDALHGIMQDLYSVAQEVMQQYDGTLQPVIGERLLVMFGAPTAQEDHAWRAVWAALDLRQRVYQGRATGGTGHGTALTVRIGLCTGLVVVGGRTNSTGTVTAVVGHVVSLAVALQERAEPGMVLCSDATAHLVRGAVHLEAVGPIRVAEQSMPVLAYAVLGHGPRRSFVEQHQHRVVYG